MHKDSSKEGDSNNNLTNLESRTNSNSMGSQWEWANSNSNSHSELQIRNTRPYLASTLNNVSILFHHSFIYCLDGQCRYGDKCSFKHGDDDNTQQSDENPEQQNMSQMPMPNMPMEMQGNMNPQ